MWPITPYADAGPLYGMMLPILISVLVAPVSYWFAASARPAVATSTTADAAVAAARQNAGRIVFVLVVWPSRKGRLDAPSRKHRSFILVSTFVAKCCSTIG